MSEHGRLRSYPTISVLGGRLSAAGALGLRTRNRSTAVLVAFDNLGGHDEAESCYCAGM